MPHSFYALLKCYETRSFKSIYKQDDLHEYTSGPALISRSSVYLFIYWCVWGGGGGEIKRTHNLGKKCMHHDPLRCAERSSRKQKQLLLRRSETQVNKLVKYF